jgi:transposase InsO family protein
MSLFPLVHPLVTKNPTFQAEEDERSSSIQSTLNISEAEITVEEKKEFDNLRKANNDDFVLRDASSSRVKDLEAAIEDFRWIYCTEHRHPSNGGRGKPRFLVLD